MGLLNRSCQAGIDGTPTLKALDTAIAKPPVQTTPHQKNGVPTLRTNCSVRCSTSGMTHSPYQRTGREMRPSIYTNCETAIRSCNTFCHAASNSWLWLNEFCCRQPSAALDFRAEQQAWFAQRDGRLQENSRGRAERAGPSILLSSTSPKLLSIERPSARSWTGYFISMTTGRQLSGFTANSRS